MSMAGLQISSFLVDFYNEIVREAPEECRIGDLKYLMSVYIYDTVARFGLFGEHFSLVAVKVNGCECAFIGLGEERAVEVAFHDFGLAEEAGLDDVVLLELVLIADSIVAGVELVCEFCVLLVG